MSNTRKTYHVVITDDQTGETLHDMHACSILAAFTDSEHTAVCNVALEASLDAVANTLASAIDEAKRVCKLNPIIELLVAATLNAVEEDE